LIGVASRDAVNAGGGRRKKQPIGRANVVIEEKRRRISTQIHDDLNAALTPSCRRKPWPQIQMKINQHM
jgi:hypothetical protein